MFRVVSDLVVGHPAGSEIVAADLPDANLAALVEAGHLEPIPVPKTPTRRKD